MSGMSSIAQSAWKSGWRQLQAWKFFARQSQPHSICPAFIPNSSMNPFVTSAVSFSKDKPYTLRILRYRLRLIETKEDIQEKQPADENKGGGPQYEPPGERREVKKCDLPC